MVSRGLVQSGKDAVKIPKFDRCSDKGIDFARGGRGRMRNPLQQSTPFLVPAHGKE